MSAVIDITAIRAERAAAAAEAAVAAQKRDPLNNPLAVLMVQLVLSQLILDQAAGKIAAMMREFSISTRRPS